MLITAGLALESNRGLALGSGNGIIEVAAAQSVTYGGIAAGSGSLTKSGNGTLTLSGASTATGAVTVSAGTLNLGNTSGAALGSITSLSVAATNAVLLVSQSNQVNDTAAITLSGGTITRGGNVSEVFGNLNVSAAATCHFVPVRTELSTCLNSHFPWVISLQKRLWCRPCAS